MSKSIPYTGVYVHIWRSVRKLERKKPFKVSTFRITPVAETLYSFFGK